MKCLWGGVRELIGAWAGCNFAAAFWDLVWFEGVV